MVAFYILGLYPWIPWDSRIQRTTNWKESEEKNSSLQMHRPFPCHYLLKNTVWHLLTSVCMVVHVVGIINRLEIETRNRRMRVVYVTAIPSDVMGKHPCILESQWLLVPIPCRYQRENVFMFETSFFKQWPAHSCDLLAALLSLLTGFLHCYQTRLWESSCRTEGSGLSTEAYTWLIVLFIPRAHALWTLLMQVLRGSSTPCSLISSSS